MILPLFIIWDTDIYLFKYFFLFCLSLFRRDTTYILDNFRLLITLCVCCQNVCSQNPNTKPKVEYCSPTTKPKVEYCSPTTKPKVDSVVRLPNPKLNSVVWLPNLKFSPSKEAKSPSNFSLLKNIKDQWAQYRVSVWPVNSYPPAANVYQLMARWSHYV